MLFRRADLVNPKASQLIKTLQTHPSLRIREANSKLLELLAMPVEEIPYLETNIFDIDTLPARTAQEEKAN